MANDVNLTLSQDVVIPIVEAKIHAAMVEIFGKKDALLQKMVQQILWLKVDERGQVSRYSSDNRHPWILTQIRKYIQDAIRDEIKRILEEGASNIREYIVRELQTKAGSKKVAKALIDGLSGTVASNWRSKINIELDTKVDDA